MDKKKILVVDDDENIVKILSINLQLEGFDVVTAFDGTTAVMQAHRHDPDLILLDIMMPAGGGLSVVENLRKSGHTFHIPIVFISALPREELDSMAAETGVSHYFSKPFDIDAIIHYIRSELYVEKTGMEKTIMEKTGARIAG
jgi:two-component system alkaline phosphatase synthesis response regulator PhoP